MIRTFTSFAGLSVLAIAASPTSFGQKAGSTQTADESKLIAVLKSDAAQKAKADACRELARVGTRDAVAPLAAFLGDEKLSHMARYGLEPIPDPAVRRKRIILEGDVPSPIKPPSGCRFHTRCSIRVPSCSENDQVLKEVSKGHWVACQVRG